MPYTPKSPLFPGLLSAALGLTVNTVIQGRWEVRPPHTQFVGGGIRISGGAITRGCSFPSLSRTGDEVKRWKKIDIPAHPMHDRGVQTCCFPSQNSVYAGRCTHTQLTTIRRGCSGGRLWGKSWQGEKRFEGLLGLNKRRE